MSHYSYITHRLISLSNFKNRLIVASAAMSNSEWLIQEIFGHCGICVENKAQSPSCSNSSTEQVVETKEAKHCNILVLDLSFYDQVLQDGSLGLGEAYMQHKWISTDLLGVMNKLVKLGESKLLWQYGIKYLWYEPGKAMRSIWSVIRNTLQTQFQNLQTIALSRRVAEEHYDYPPLLYERMLDSNMQYSCGYWSSNTTNLEQAQLNKLNMIVAKLHIEDGMNVLDIGCGFGGLVAFMALKYRNSQVYGISISKEQVNYAKQKYNHLSNAHFLLADYRTVDFKPYNISRVCSVGALEHVGFKNYADYFRFAYHKCLQPGGIFLCHSITIHQESAYTDPWLEKHIFPGGRLPSVSRVVQEAQSQQFHCEDIHNFGLCYAATLKAWFENFDRAWSELKEKYPTQFDDVFYRKWKYYLHICQSAFLTRHVELHQFVFTKEYNVKVYDRPTLEFV